MGFPRPYGRYILEERLAMGGMAEIFRARTAQAGFEKKVCIKRVLPHYLEDEEFVTMFRDEARTAAKLQHANVVQVFDFGEVDDDSGATLYLAMELVEGADLRRVMEHGRKKQIPFELGEVVQIGIEMCRGLHHAHSLQEGGRPLGIVHRDVSPHNVMISRNGEVKVMDFGIAKAAERATHTSTGIVKGKVAYMSPEQAEGKHFDHRLDQWAVGVVLWELLCGERLFRGENDATILRKVMSVEVPQPSSKRDDVPDALEDIVLQALQGNPDDRFANLRQMELALSRFLFSGQIDPATAEVRNVFPRIVDAGADPQPKRTNVIAAPAIPPPAPRTERLEDLAVSSTGEEAPAQSSAFSSSGEESAVFVSSAKLPVAPGPASSASSVLSSSGAPQSLPTTMGDDPRLLEQAARQFEKQRSSASQQNLKAPGPAREPSSSNKLAPSPREPSRRNAPSPAAETVVADGMLQQEADRVMSGAQAAAPSYDGDDGDAGTPATRTLVPAGEKSQPNPPSITTPTPVVALQLPREAPPSRKPLVAAAAILSVGVVAAALIIVSNNGPAPTPPATTSPAPPAPPSPAPPSPAPPATTAALATPPPPEPTPAEPTPAEPTPAEPRKAEPLQAETLQAETGETPKKETPKETPKTTPKATPKTEAPPPPPKAESPKAESPKAESATSAIPGSVYVDVPGSWADIYIGKKPYGQTPTTLKLAPGKYNVTLENPETKKKRTFPVTIVSGAKTQINQPL